MPINKNRVFDMYAPYEKFDWGIGKVVRKMEEEILEKVNNKKDEEISVLDQSEAAVVAAGQLLEGFESIVEDDSKRMKATTGSGIVVGAGINFLLDASVEKDGKKKSELYRKGGVTTMEILTGAVKTIIAGERRRKL